MSTIDQSVTLADTVRRLTLLEDERSITALVHSYARSCDPIDPTEIANLFTEDATWTARSADGSTDFGKFVGRDGIRAGFAALEEQFGEPTLHCVAVPEISIDSGGGTATGDWYLLLVTRFKSEGVTGPPILLGTKYDHDFVKVEDQWLIKRLNGEIQFMIPLPA